jgi:rod shape-determining protein MreD
MTAQIAKGGALIFLASIVQASILNRVTILSGAPYLILVVLVGAAFIAGSVPGAVGGFLAGLILDTATLGTLGVMSLLLTLTGYWSGRYGETTGRDKGHAPLLAIGVATLLFMVGGLALRFVLGEQSDGMALVRGLPASVAWDLLLMAAAFPLLKRLLARQQAGEAQEVRLLG